MEDYLNCHYCYICTLIKDSSDNFRFGMCFVFHVRFFFFVIVKIELFVPLLCACALPGKAIPEMTFTVSGGTLNPIHSLTHFICCCYSSCCCQCSSNCHFAATGGRTTTRRLIRVAMTAGLLFSQALVLWYLHNQSLVTRPITSASHIMWSASQCPTTLTCGWEVSLSFARYLWNLVCRN